MDSLPIAPAEVFAADGDLATTGLRAHLSAIHALTQASPHVFASPPGPFACGAEDAPAPAGSAPFSSAMVSSPSLHVSRSLRALLGPLHELAVRCPCLEGTAVGEFFSAGQPYAVPRFRLRGPEAGAAPIRLGLFAGVHGDEAAGCAALCEFLAALTAAPERAAGYDLWAYPVCNPAGYEAGVRGNGAGKDLNREFWRSSTEPEARILEAELRAGRFHGIIALHADDTCDGVYGYAHGRLLNEALLGPALQAAASVLPLDPRGTIDGFPAKGGVIGQCFCGVLAAPPNQTPRPFDLIFETPALAPFDRQVRAGVLALETILTEYRRFLAYAQDL